MNDEAARERLIDLVVAAAQQDQGVDDILHPALRVTRRRDIVDAAAEALDEIDLDHDTTTRAAQLLGSLRATGLFFHDGTGPRS